MKFTNIKHLSLRRSAEIFAIAAAIVLPIGAQATDEEWFDETRDTITLFSFDEVSIPFTQNLKLEMRKPEKHAANPVVARGPEGSSDSWAVQFYGSVIRDSDTGKHRMWYVSVSKAERERSTKTDSRSAPWRVGYAESDDGITWEKPELGLVELNGSTANNLCKIEPHLGILNLKVLDEPDDPDPTQRYKMAAHVWTPKSETRRNGTLAPLVSTDGFTWRFHGDAKALNAELPEADTVVPPLHLEPAGGLYKWDGLYHTSGQNAIAAARPYHGRVSRTSISADFAHWSQTSAIQAVRTHQHVLLGPGRSREGEQTHEGISVWNRGNVLVGISGMWHGTPEWEDLTIDLGFVVSNDGIRFHEPMEEWTFLHRGEDGTWDQGGLLQGQGFENVGDQTRIYYGAWDPRNWEKSPPRGGVGIAVLPRDRFADLVVDESTTGPGDYQMETTVSSFLTKSIEVAEGEHRLYVNADGLSDNAVLKIELLDHSMNPIKGFAGDDAARVTASGFQTALSFSGKDTLTGLPGRVRARVTFEGDDKTAIRFSALYLR